MATPGIPQVFLAPTAEHDLSFPIRLTFATDSQPVAVLLIRQHRLHMLSWRSSVEDLAASAKEHLLGCGDLAGILIKKGLARVSITLLLQELLVLKLLLLHREVLGSCLH